MPDDSDRELERAERAALCLSGLARDVLELSARGRLTNAEIGRRLGISERRAERILGRALRKFDCALNRGSSV